MTMVLLSEALRILEFQAQSAQPWDRRAVPIQRGFTENWVVRSFIEPNQKSVALDFHVSAGRHQPLVRLLRLDLLVSGQPRYQSAIATMRDHRKRHIQVHIQDPIQCDKSPASSSVLVGPCGITCLLG